MSEILKGIDAVLSDEKLWSSGKTILKKVKEEVEQLEAELDKSRAIIDKLSPPHQHDHDYYHANCGLCQREKANREILFDEADAQARG